ncbi:MAG: hypothetical protein M3271_12275, partial [Actinomycetota bacterium]|nr:hypothetical protein [Actinomycetota bacterium]
ECETSFNELLSGGPGNDEITGGELAGDNVATQDFVPGPGDDVVDSGRAEEEPGSEDCGILGHEPCHGMLHHRDVVDYTDATGPVTVDLAGRTASGEGDDTLLGIDAVMGSRFDDVIAGDDTANVLFGGDGFGYDRLSGAGTNDLLIGGYGSDHLDGGDGAADEADGGSGTDTCVASEHRDECEL